MPSDMNLDICLTQAMVNITAMHIPPVDINISISLGYGGMDASTIVYRGDTVISEGVYICHMWYRGN